MNGQVPTAVPSWTGPVRACAASTAPCSATIATSPASAIHLTKGERPVQEPGAPRGVTAGVLDAPCPSGRTERGRNLLLVQRKDKVFIEKINACLHRTAQTAPKSGMERPAEPLRQK